MRNRFSFSFLRWISLSLLFFAIVLLIFQLIRFGRLWATYPSGLTIAGVPVGNLDRQQAAQRLLEIYTLPVESTNDNTISLWRRSVDRIWTACYSSRPGITRSFWWRFGISCGTVHPADAPVVNYSNDRSCLPIQ
jgi:hypothetical protein